MTESAQAGAVARRMLTLLATTTSLEDFQFELARIRATTAVPELAEVEAILLQALQIRIEQSERSQRESELNDLLSGMREVAQQTDDASVLTAIVSRTRRLLLTDSAYYLRYEAGSGFSMHVSTGLMSTAFATVRFDDAYGICGYIREHGRPVWSNNYLADERFAHSSVIDRGAAEEGLRAVIAAPVLARDELVGILFAADRSYRTFTQRDAALLGELAIHAGIFLDRVSGAGESAAQREPVGAALDSLESVHAQTSRVLEFQDRLLAIVMRHGTVEEVLELCNSHLTGRIILTEDLPVFPEAGRTAIEFAVAGVYGERSVLRLERDDEGEPSAVEQAALSKAAHACSLLRMPERNRNLERQARTGTALRNALEGGNAHADRELLTLAALEPDEIEVLSIDLPEEEDSRLLVQSMCGAIGAIAVEFADAVAVLARADASVAREIRARMRASDTPLTIGRSRPRDGSEAIAELWRRADTARLMLHALGRAGGEAESDELAGLPSVFARAGRGELRAVIETELGDLIAYDRTHETRLLDTLRTVYASGGQLRAAAEQLHVHLNTLHQRLQRVEAITGSPWQDDDARLRRMIALRAHDISSEMKRIPEGES